MFEGWAAAAAAASAVVGAASAYSASSDAEKAREQSAENAGNRIEAEKEAQEKETKRAIWLNQQQRYWQQLDRERFQKGMQQFGNFAPEYAKTFNGQEVTDAAPADPRAGLMDFSPTSDADVGFAGYFGKPPAPIAPPEDDVLVNRDRPKRIVP